MVTYRTINKQSHNNGIRNDINTNKMNNNTSSTKTKKINIGFYNVENLFDIYDDPQTSDEDFTPNGIMQWDKERYNDKLEDLAEVIDDFNPVILGLAEVENFDVINDLIKQEELAEINYKIIHAENNDTRGIDVAAIYNADIFNLNDYRYHRVSGKGNSNTRDILELNGNFMNQSPLTIFITHWPSRRKGTNETEYKRISIAKQLRSIIDKILQNNSNENIIIMGDFNDEPSDISIHKYLMKDDFYNLHKKYEDKNIGTVNHRGEWLVFDQIIISKSLLDNNTYQISTKSGEIFNDEDITFTHRDGNKSPSRTYGGIKYYGGISDHYPVFAKLVVKY